MAEKSTNVEMEFRINQVIRMLLSGVVKRSDIIRFITEKTDWNVQERQIENYIARAKEELKDMMSDELEYQKGLALSRYSDLYAKSLKIQDYANCRQIQKEINIMLGLNEPEKKQIELDHQGMTDEAREKLFNKLIEVEKEDQPEEKSEET